MRRTISSLTVGLGLFIILIFGGCVRYVYDATEVEFSHDGTMVAYIWEKQKLVQTMDEGYFAMERTESIGLNSVDFPNQSKVVKINKVVKAPSYLARAKLKNIEFSLNGRSILLVREKRIDVVDIASGDYWRVTPEKSRSETELIDSCHWTGPDTIVYSVQLTSTTDGSRSVVKKIYRQLVTKPLPERVELFSSITSNDIEPFEEFWSPDHEAILTVGQLDMHILDVKTGEISPSLRQTSAKSKGVAWSPDSSKVFCAFGWPWDQTGQGGAILVDRYTYETKDFSDKIGKYFGVDQFYVHGWTHDGNYIIGWTMPLGACLIQLEPWKVDIFEMKHQTRLPLYQAAIRDIRPLRPGWLAVIPRDDGKTYAVDYQAKYIIPIAERNWALSPDEKYIAEVPELSTVRVRKLDLPEVEFALPPEAWKPPLSVEIHSQSYESGETMEQKVDRAVSNTTAQPTTKPASKQKQPTTKPAR